MAPNFITGSLALTLAEACPSVSVSGQDGSFLCVYSTQPDKKARSGHREEGRADGPEAPGPVGRRKTSYAPSLAPSREKRRSLWKLP